MRNIGGNNLAPSGAQLGDNGAGACARFPNALRHRLGQEQGAGGPRRCRIMIVAAIGVAMLTGLCAMIKHEDLAPARSRCSAARIYAAAVSMPSADDEYRRLARG